MNLQLKLFLLSSILLQAKLLDKPSSMLPIQVPIGNADCFVPYL